MLTWQNEQGSQHSPWYGWEFCLLRSRNINETQSIENRIAVIDHKVTCSVTGILDSFIRHWKKTGRCRKVILAVRDTHALVAVAVVERFK